MKKWFLKLSPFVLAFALLLPSTGAFASEVDGVSSLYGQIGSGLGNSVTSSINGTDNNLSSYFSLTSYGTSNDSVWYHLSSPFNVSSFSVNTSGTYKISFFDSNQTLKAHTSSLLSNKSYEVGNVSYVLIENTNASSISIYDINVYGNFAPTISHNPVTNLTITNITSSSAKLTWDLPTDTSHISSVNIYKDGSLLTNRALTTYYVPSLLPDKNYKFEIELVYDDGSVSSKVPITFKSAIDYQPISNVQVTSKAEKTVSFSWTEPSSSQFAHTSLYLNGEPVTDLLKGTNTYTFDNLDPGTEYTFGFEAVYTDGTKEPKVSQKVTTVIPPKPAGDVKNVDVETDYNRVDLSWNLPTSSNFKHVNIYRDEKVEEPSFFKSFFIGTIVNAAEEPTKIFETNGTYFNDLTVQPETTYEYKLTTQSTEGLESDGVTVEATTLTEPTPEMGGVTDTKDENGDFVYSWSSPEKGQVKILVAGNEYKTVDASLKSVTIPKDQMKYNMFGKPDVSLVAVSEFGTVGESYDPGALFSNMSLPFGPNGLLKTGMQLLMILGPFVLLSLSFVLVPRLRKTLFNAFKSKKRSEA